MSKGRQRSSRRSGEIARWALAWALALGWSALLGGLLAPAPRPPAAGATLGLVRVAPAPGAGEGRAAHDSRRGPEAARQADPPAPAKPHQDTAPPPPVAPRPVAEMTHLPESAATPRFREHAARPPLAPPPPREHLAAAESPPAPALHGLPSPHPATARTAGRPAAPLPQAGSNRQAGASPSDGAPAARSAAAGGTAAEVTAVAPERLDAGFRLLAPVSPAYPEQARLLGRGGQVRVELAVGRDGSVERVQVLDETGRWGFGHAVRQAYRGARFSPPTVGGRPVRVLWRQTVIFRP